MKWINKNNKWLCIILIFVSALLAILSRDTRSKEVVADVSMDIDTYIPVGYVLVPIIVHNSESLDSIFGSFGIVDLYSIEQNEKKSAAPLVRAVKMLRAPKNPSQFGVLVKDKDVAKLVQNDQGFFVVLHHPKTSGTPLERRIQKPIQRKIRFEEDI